MSDAISTLSYISQPRTPIAALPRESPVQGPAAEAVVDVRLLGNLQQLQPVLQQATNEARAYAELATEHGADPRNSDQAAYVAHRREVAQLSQRDAQRGLQRLSEQFKLMFGPDEDAAPPPNPADMDASGLVWGSHSDFYAQIAALLGVLQTEWLSKYQDALATYLEFYTEFSDIMEKLPVTGTGDKGDVIVDFGAVYQKLKDLAAEYGLPENAMATFSTEAEAQAFIDSMGLPGLTISNEGGDGKFRVMMDTSAVNDLVASMGSGGRQRMDAARYNAWVSSKDSNMEQIKHVSKVLGEKLSEMTQKFDNIVKILSSTIDKITEADMSFIHGL